MQSRLREDFPDRVLQLAEFRLGDRWSGDQHHIPPWGNCGEAKTHDLAQPAAHPIPHHRAAYPPADREAEAAAGQIVGQDAHHEQAMSPAFAMTADLVETVAAGQPMLPFQGLPGPLSIGHRGGQALAALHAAPLDHIATIPGAHALAKAMHAQPSAHLGLESSLGHRKVRVPFFGYSDAAAAGRELDFV